MSLLRTENIWFSYQPGNWTLQDISLDISPGGIIVLVGSSGSGKTTLLKILGGLLTPSRGKVFLFGEEARNGKMKIARRKIGYIPQHLGLVRNLTVLKNVLIGSLGRTKGLGAFFGFFPKEEVERAYLLLGQLGIGHKANEKVFHLSGGERQRVAIARTLMQNPALILADEFVSDLDVKTTFEILRTVQKIGRDNQVAFVMSMHDLQVVRELDGQVLVMKSGCVVKKCCGKEMGREEFEELMR